MKLRATIKRSRMSNGQPSVTFTFPKDAKNDFMWENILKRNLGPRPYSEGAFVNKEGQRVRFFCK